jgi:hypothetical protein
MSTLVVYFIFSVYTKDASEDKYKFQKIEAPMENLSDCNAMAKRLNENPEKKYDWVFATCR